MVNEWGILLNNESLKDFININYYSFYYILFSDMYIMDSCSSHFITPSHRALLYLKKLFFKGFFFFYFQICFCV